MLILVLLSKYLPVMLGSILVPQRDVSPVPELKLWSILNFTELPICGIFYQSILDQSPRSLFSVNLYCCTTIRTWLLILSKTLVLLLRHAYWFLPLLMHSPLSSFFIFQPVAGIFYRIFPVLPRKCMHFILLYLYACKKFNKKGCLILLLIDYECMSLKTWKTLQTFKGTSVKGKPP